MDRPGTGSRPNTPCCSRRSSWPPPSGRLLTPGNFPGRYWNFSSGGGTGTAGPPARTPPCPPPRRALTGHARALNSIGWYHALLGDPQQALIHCRQALALRRNLGDRRGEAHTLDSIGYAHHLLGHHEQAAAYYQQSLILKGEVGDRHGQA